MFTLTKQKIIRFAFWWLIIIPGIPFVLTTLAITAYVYWPRDYSNISEIKVPEGTEYITLSAHGVNDTAASWSDSLQKVMASVPYPQVANVATYNHSIDWQDYSSNVFICSVSGRKIGKEIGRNLALHTGLKAIHAIGHSCGAFVVLGICEGAKSVNSNIIVQTSYLDSVSVYSGVFWDYGIKHFGSCGNFTDNYIDTRDTVPGSNVALPHAYTFDVSNMQTKQELQYPPHAWPPHYYIKAYKTNTIPILYKANPDSIEPLKKGELRILKP